MKKLLSFCLLSVIMCLFASVSAFAEETSPFEFVFGTQQSINSWIIGQISKDTVKNDTTITEIGFMISKTSGMSKNSEHNTIIGTSTVYKKIYANDGYIKRDESDTYYFAGIKIEGTPNSGSQNYYVSTYTKYSDGTTKYGEEKTLTNSSTAETPFVPV